MCKFCENYDFGGIGFDFEMGRDLPTLFFPSHIGAVPEEERFKFCPVCGERLTAEHFKPPKERKAATQKGEAPKFLIVGHWYKFDDRGETHIGNYIGRQSGFECCVCGKGQKVHTFNIWHSASDYETWGYGEEYLPTILEDLGELHGIVLDK